MVRHGEMDPGDPARRFDGTDAALARIDTLLGGLPSAETALRRRLRLDRLVALRNRVRMEEARAEGEALRADAPLPPYAEAAYADALLYLRQPDAAGEAYRRILAQTPEDVEARYGLFYALLELENFSAAFAVIDDLVGSEPESRRYSDDPTPYAQSRASQRGTDSGRRALLGEPARRRVGPPRPPRRRRSGACGHQVGREPGQPRARLAAAQHD